jgi:hypothetical protein
MAAAFRELSGLLALPLLFFSYSGALSSDAVETIAFVRHGEKPAAGLGQLDCQGLNRALALPKVVANTFGRPAAIFAPDPSVQKTDEGEPYDYVRPLATIEPTAIAFGLPVNASVGVFDTRGLQAAIEAPRFQNAFVLVAFEHKVIDDVVRAILTAHGGDAASVPNGTTMISTASMS